MKSSTSLFKTINNDLLSKLNIKLSRKYYFNKGDNQVEIKEVAVGNENEVKLDDESLTWNPKKDKLYLNIFLKIINCNLLFGETGLCYGDAIVGIGLSWKGNRERLINSYKLGEITNQDTDKEIIIENIPLSNINSNLTFKLFFYIEKTGSKNGKPFYANEVGMIIYEEKMWEILIEGNGSVFPIEEISDSKGPLWNISINNIIDITEDPFDSDNVRILLNKQHKLYGLLNPNSKEYNKDFLNEVLSSALVLLILSIRETCDNKFDLSLECERGSILLVIKYFNEKLGFKVNDSYEELLKSVKTYFDKEC